MGQDTLPDVDPLSLLIESVTGLHQRIGELTTVVTRLGEEVALQGRTLGDLTRQTSALGLSLTGVIDYYRGLNERMARFESRPPSVPPPPPPTPLPTAAHPGGGLRLISGDVESSNGGGRGQQEIL